MVRGAVNPDHRLPWPWALEHTQGSPRIDFTVWPYNALAKFAVCTKRGQASIMCVGILDVLSYGINSDVILGLTVGCHELDINILHIHTLASWGACLVESKLRACLVEPKVWPILSCLQWPRQLLH